ncbi:MAG TPA: phage tail protein [Acidimicrobiales bacterium]|jgi:phage tail-like protein|nr:phage tail protein [Acidimicrobiales bacterium]
MPAGLGGNMSNDAIAASRFSVTVDGYEIAQFSELTGITTEVDVIDFMENNNSADSILKKLPGKHKPPTITLKRGKNMSMELWAWHEAVLHGDIAGARKSGSVVMYGYDGKAVARYHFENGWPSKISIGALKAGASEILMEEVTIVCEHLERVAP